MLTDVRRSNTAGRSAVTMLELLAVIAILALITALLLPAISSGREAARRVQCSAQLRDLGVAAAQVAERDGRYPDRTRFNAYAMPLIAVIESMEYVESVVAAVLPVETPIAATMSVWICPTDDLSDPRLGHQNFLMCRGRGGHSQEAEGMLPYSRTTPGRSRVADGMSNTALFSERLIARRLSQSPFWTGASSDIERDRAVWYSRTAHAVDAAGLSQFLSDCRSVPKEDLPMFPHWPLYWGDSWGYNHAFPPNSPACMNGPPPDGMHAGPEVDNASQTASSRHGGGVNVLYVDGHVRFVSSSVDVSVWAAAGTVAGSVAGGGS